MRGARKKGVGKGWDDVKQIVSIDRFVCFGTQPFLIFSYIRNMYARACTCAMLPTRALCRLLPRSQGMGASRADGLNTPSVAGKPGGEGVEMLDSDVLPIDNFDDLQELIKVVCPALARLLSFEHLRYDNVDVHLHCCIPLYSMPPLIAHPLCQPSRYPVHYFFVTVWCP